MHQATFVIDLALVLGVAAITAVVARVLKQSTILGYLFAGLIVGPYIPIPIFADLRRVEAMAEFGVVLVMFTVGLEFSLTKLMRVIPRSGVTGLLQVSFLGWSGFLLGELLQWSKMDAVFLGACIAISSTMVVTKVFEQIKVNADVREHVYGVLVIQDVVAVVLIALLTGLATGKGTSVSELFGGILRLLAVLAAMLLVGMLIVPRIIVAIRRYNNVEITVVVATGLCFLLAALAEHIGYSVALGAFLAGVLVAESGQGHAIEKQLQSLKHVFAAIFFVSIGMSVNPMMAVHHLPVVLAVSAVVILAQFLSVTISGLISAQGVQRSVASAFALGQIGEFAFIIAAIGISAKVVNPSLQTIVVAVAVVTTFTTPLLLKRAGWIAEKIDHRMPTTLRRFLGLYEDWLTRFRFVDALQRSPIRKAMVALAVDGSVMLFLLGAAIVWWRVLQQKISISLEVSRAVAEVGMLLAVMLVLMPIVFHLSKNAFVFSKVVSEIALQGYDSGSQNVVLAKRTIRMMLHVLMLVSLSVPVVVLLGLLTKTSYAISVFGFVVFGVSAYVWSNARSIDIEFRSGAQVIAQSLRRQGTHRRPITHPDLLPGLDKVQTLAIHAGSYAVGKSLSELNLRAATGATVVAIRHLDKDVSLPTGREQLKADDRLAVIGSNDAIIKADALLRNGPLQA